MNGVGLPAREDRNTDPADPQPQRKRGTPGSSQIRPD
jgi:hypothetical protein